MGVVVFDYARWSGRYPELAGFIAEPTAELYFAEAQLYCDNTECSPIRDANPGGVRELLLNMVTAHIAALNAPLNGNPSSPLVGRISNATEGSVTVAAELNLEPGSSQWFAQSKYGLAFWQATRRYRSARYVAVPGQVNPYSYQGFPGWGPRWPM